LAESGDLKKFTLARSEAFENGVLLAVYQPGPADSA